ncbi:MAG TPA: amidase [Burkholderiales bacterium]|nr:amidase [Burkholderiales bacterium]
MNDTGLAYLSVAEQAALIKKREISPVDLVEIYLGRIEKWDRVLHSWITVCADAARRQARQTESEIAAGRYLGPLHGIPFGAKDQIATGDVPTTMASVIQPDFGDGMTATAVQKLQDAGAILLGKNNLHEFGKGSSVNFHYGEPKNPWNIAYEPSHSSTGSGISVAAGLVSVALGEDTGGSIRGPAWANGVVGVRPTFGRVSRHGGIMYAWTQDTIGPLTRTVADNALVLQAIAGHDPKDPLSSTRPVPEYGRHLTPDLKGMKLGLVREMSVGQTLHPEVERMLGAALAVLRALGATVEEVSLPRAKFAVPLQFLTSDPDVAAVFLRKWLKKHWNKFDVGTRTRIAAAALVPAIVYARAMRARALVRNEILGAFRSYDALLALMNFVPPLRLQESVEKIESREDVASRMFKSRRMCTYPFSIANVPALSVPSGFTADGVPMSIQIAARPFDETTMYRVAHAYEQATGWHLRHPDLEKTVGPALQTADAQLTGA